MGPAAEEVDGVVGFVLARQLCQVAVHVFVGGGVGREAVLHGVEGFIALCFEHELCLTEGVAALFEVVAADGAGDVYSLHFDGINGSDGGCWV